MSELDVLELTKDLVRIKSVSDLDNAPVADFLEPILERYGFVTERIVYTDPAGTSKTTLVASKGSGEGGIGFFSHSDTVPGTGWSTDPWTPVVQGDRLIGLGACDMKGPLAASIVAAAQFDASALNKTVFIAATADEEVGFQGAREMVARSELLRNAKLSQAIVPEPTSLAPVYGHKGGAGVVVSAYGVAAHTSNDTGISATFLIAPFLNDMAELAKEIKRDISFHRSEFVPPTPGFNVTITDYGTKGNVTAAKTTVSIGFRPMPGDRTDDLIKIITDKAESYGLEAEVRGPMPGFSTDPNAPIVRTLAAATDRTPRTVSYGSEASLYARDYATVVCGPGSIVRAHSDGEWIEIAELREAVEVYSRLIDTFCLAK